MAELRILNELHKEYDFEEFCVGYSLLYEYLSVFNIEKME